MFHVSQDLITLEVWKASVLANSIENLIMSLFVWLLVILGPAIVGRALSSIYLHPLIIL